MKKTIDEYKDLLPKTTALLGHSDVNSAINGHKMRVTRKKDGSLAHRPKGFSCGLGLILTALIPTGLHIPLLKGVGIPYLLAHAHIDQPSILDS